VESAKLLDLGTKSEVDNLQDCQLDWDPYTLFIHAIKSPVTKEKYQRRLMIFFDFIKISGDSMQERCIVFAKNGKNTNWIFNNILQFVLFYKERINRKEITGATLFNYLKAIKLFCEMSDISINWKKLTRGLSRGRRYANDRAPSLKEIKKIIQYPDRRIKPIVYVMCSSGIRLSAWDYLKWKNVIPLKDDKENNTKIIAAKLVVYAEEEEEYFTFISSEAYHSLIEWMNYRKAAGENINKES
jgi:hypothetical protein